MKGCARAGREAWQPEHSLARGRGRGLAHAPEPDDSWPMKLSEYRNSSTCFRMVAASEFLCRKGALERWEDLAGWAEASPWHIPSRPTAAKKMADFLLAARLCQLPSCLHCSRAVGRQVCTRRAVGQAHGAVEGAGQVMSSAARSRRACARPLRLGSGAF